MEQETVKRLMKELASIEADRQPLEKVWQLCYDFADPANAFITKEYYPANIINPETYATVAKRALPKFVAAIHSTVTPSNQRWHDLSAPTDELRREKAVVEWYEALTNVLFSERYRMNSGFNKAITKVWKNQGIVGHAPLMIDDSVGEGIVYRPIEPKQFFFRLDKNKRLRKCWYKFTMPYDDLVEWLNDNGIDEKAIPETYQNQSKYNPNLKIEVTHCVYKLTAKEELELSVGDRNYLFWSCYIVKSNDGDVYSVIREHGLFTCPYCVPRYEELDNDVYSSSPTQAALADLMMMNRMRKSNVNGVEKAVDPPLLALDDKSLSGMAPKAASIIYGGINTEGREMMKPLDITGNAGMGVEMEERIKLEVEEHYLKPQFMQYFDKQNMTATEVSQLTLERAMLMSIFSCPIEEELLYPMIRRELDILYRQGKFPDPIPQEVQELIDRNDLFFSIQYEGSANRAQKIQENIAIMETANVLGTFMGVEPMTRHVMKWFEAATRVAKNNNTPTELIASELEYTEAVQADYERQKQIAAAASSGAGVADSSADTIARWQGSVSGRL